MLDWLQGAGLGDIANEFFRKLSVAVNLLCVPRTSLLKVNPNFSHLTWGLPASGHFLFQFIVPMWVVGTPVRKLGTSVELLLV